ncbi:MAG: Hsp70 family protein, partial [Candidatus Atribacteria bacterium]|nr:Hsp70 family protein [Candidatus Atribacteria bacterium]
TFHLDVNGILQVKALDLYTDNEKSVQINSSSRLTHEQINSMIKDAQIHAKDDQRHKDKIQVGIQAESMIQAARVAMEECEDFIDKSTVNKIEKLILTIKSTLYKGDYNDTKVKINDLKKLIKIVYNAYIPKSKQNSNVGAR